MKIRHRSHSCCGVALFVIVALFHGGEALAAPTPGQLFWVDTQNPIRRAELDGSGIVSVAPGSVGVSDFVVDRRTNHIYWKTFFNVFRSEIGGSTATTIFTFPSFAFDGDITLDPVHNHLFFVDSRNNAIYRSNLDGSGASTIVPAHGIPSNGTGVYNLSLDMTNEKLYWNDVTAIRRGNLDGSNAETLFTLPGVPDNYADFAVAPGLGKIYMAFNPDTAGGSTVRRMNLDGSGQEIVASGFDGISGIAIDEPGNRFYFTETRFVAPNMYASTIRASALTGGASQIVVNLGTSFSQIYELAFVPIPEPGTTCLASIASLTVLLGRRRRVS
jgi:hypothetical protein